VKQDSDKDSTRVRKPTSTVGKIPRQYKASLVIIKGYAEGMEYPLELEHTVLGRDKTAGIAVKDELVSRQHAAIVYRDGEFRLEDLGSTNGTIMNGALIETATLRHKDKFRIGDTTLQFILEVTKHGTTYEIS
jgi:pSer/pThr/pTyr-binding forkhead associated (FHA) protein